MRRSSNSYNPTTSRNHNPYSGIFNDDDSDDDNDDISQALHLKILGPLAPILLSNEPSNPEELQNRMRIYAVSILGTSAFFWLWALFNTYHLRSSGGFDLGVVSFLGSGISSVLLLRSALGGGKCYDRNQRYGCCGKNDMNENDEVDMYGERKSKNGRMDADPSNHAPPGTHLRYFVVLSQIAVVANYFVGILFAFTAGGTRVYVYFATYCIIFLILWLIVAYAGWVIVTVYREAVGRVYGELVLNGPPRLSLYRRGLISLTNRTGGFGSAANDDYEHEEDDIDDELRALYEGLGGYTNN